MFLYFVIIKAMISVPPELPPCDMDIPIPNPAMEPPMIEHINFPFDKAKSWITGAGILCEVTASLDDRRGQLFFCSAKLTVNGKLCCKGEPSFALVPIQQ